MTKTEIIELLRPIALHETDDPGRSPPAAPTEPVLIKCTCGQTMEFSPQQIYPMAPDVRVYLKIFRTVCTYCNRLDYWIEWPSEKQMRRNEFKALQVACDDVIRQLQ